MPFKFRLKKSRQYNVVSKSLFVICVELLDGATIECTLSSESVGRECLDNVCQRLGLQQPEFFGLRYVNRHGAPRWVEMERPVKKQLDKYAKEPNLYLRVMYYVNGISLIQDEMTRYHYFLQLKKDVIEGRINCTLKQATTLASYCMQAEFGNHDLERHTAEYLKDFALFPTHLLQEGHLETLTKAVILQHAELAGLPQGTAEEYYILAAQQLEGYGQETFLAKDDCGNEVVIGIALIGIYVMYDNNNHHQPKIYQWKDITNVINHKRHFGMELHEQADPVQFQLPDIETAKYIWRMCVHQHTFFVQNESASSSEPGNTTQAVRNLFSQLRNDDGQVASSHEELDRVDNVPVERLRAQSTSCLDLAHSSRNDIERLRAMLPSYRPAPDYETAIQQKYRGHAVLYSSQPEIHQTNLHENVIISDMRSYANAYKHFPDVARVDRVYVEQPEENHRPHNLPTLHTYSTPDLDGNEGGVVVQLYKPPPPYRPNSNSTPDLASQPLQPTHTFISTQHLDDVGGNNIVYYMGRGNAVLHQPSGQPQPAMRQFSHRQEPIYENIPLNWTPEGNEPRSRAASIQSAPEMRIPQEQFKGNQHQNHQPQHNHQTQHIHQPQHNHQSPPQNLQNNHQSQPQQPMSHNHQSQTQHNQQSHQLTTMQPSQQQGSSPSHDRIHGFNVSIDSSTRSSDGSQSGTLGKTGKSKGRKWVNLLGSGGKNKQATLPKQSESIRVPLPTTITKEAMCQLLEKKLLDYPRSTLFFEFEKIHKQKSNCDFGTASLSENLARNRFNDVLPYEETRVRLSPSKENKYGYINASHITATVGTQQRFYIAAQSPLTSTIREFWQMIWECEVYLVVSLPAPGEEIAPYLPTPDRILHAGKFEVMCQFSQATGHCATSKLRIQDVDSKSFRGIWHLQYTEWGHQGCPNAVPHFLGFLEEVSSVRQHTMTEIPGGHNKNPPALVHCSSGVGPTAVTILSDLLLFTIDHNQELDIPRVVHLLRQQRMLMIQNISQYSFVHRLLIYYLKNSRLI
ncbi:tyrosine-protein phosphatase non-receptor type 21 isoform X3 [Halyomorpha halys]|uniref:tyrosine-protein phosphatase non-receptor type 21 isoform X3 n=1 Tax=Halyomorpha halys TaxID=286706 RepID=UPI0006D4DAD9|nr:tyrosine-protein phosphatase non-receptor type 21 isoform X2 [Halyomorpha halys]